MMSLTILFCHLLLVIEFLGATARNAIKLRCSALLQTTPSKQLTENLGAHAEAKFHQHCNPITSI